MSPTKSAIQQFIFTLGPEFETIQNNFRIGNLPPEWHTEDWPTLLVLCRNYSNSVNSQALLKCDHPKPTGGSDGTNHDRANHHKKVRKWFLNPSKFKTEMEAEQQKCPGKCIYHLTDSHPTETCSIKKECDRILAQRSNGNPNSTTNGNVGSPSAGQLSNVKEAIPEESIEELDDSEAMIDSEHNDTNDSDLFYFARMTNHYLRLAKSSSIKPIQGRHTMEFPIIADSGANFHMFKEIEFFETLTPAKGKVILGDGTTTLNIF
jgi:hypothetical protein